MRVLVTGGRVFQDRDWLWAGLDLLSERIGGITEIIEGGAPGADARAQEWGLRHGVKVTTCEAEWEKHGRSAGMIRNRQMAEMHPDVVLACPGGRGTTNMVEVAQKMGLRVVFLEKMGLAKKGGSGVKPPEVIIDGETL